MRYNSFLVILGTCSCLVGTTACGPLLPEGAGAVTGTIQGTEFNPRSSLFAVSNGTSSDSNTTAGQTITITLFNQPGVCNNAMNSANTMQADSLSFTMQTPTGQALQPGTFPVQYVDPTTVAGAGVPVLAAPGDPNTASQSVTGIAAQVIYEQANDQCRKTLAAAANAGSVTLVQVDTGSTIAGSFNVIFSDSSTLSGTFDAAVCSALNNSYTQCF